MEAFHSVVQSGLPHLHHDAPFELDWRTILGLGITFLGSALASSAGIGGGALFVPMFHVLLGFGMKTSTTLSQTVITGGAIASMLINAFKCSPMDPSKPLIDFSLVLVFMPVLLMGVNMGVLMNSMIPEWFLTLLLVVLILYLTVAALKKGTMLWRLETEAKAARHILRHHLASAVAAAKAEHDCSIKLPISTNPKMGPPSEMDFARVNHSSSHEQEAGQYVQEGANVGEGPWGGMIPATHGTTTCCEPGAPEPLLLQHGCSRDTEAGSITGPFASRDLEIATPAADPPHTMTEIMYPSRSHLSATLMKRPPLGGTVLSAPAPPHLRRAACCGPSTAVQTGQLVVLWVLFSALQLFKAQVPLCSPPFWHLCLAQLATMVVAVVAFSGQTMIQQRLENQEQEQEAVGMRRPLLPKSETSPQRGSSFTCSSMMSAQFITLLAGLAGGLLGIGGGMVMSPLLLELGTEPMVAAATVSLMVLFSSSTAVFQFAAMGRLNLHYSAVFSVDSLLASLIGVMVLNHVVRRSGKASIVVFILAGVVAVGGLTTGLVGVLQGWHDFQTGTHIGFSSLCPTAIGP